MKMIIGFIDNIIILNSNDSGEIDYSNKTIFQMVFGFLITRNPSGTSKACKLTQLEINGHQTHFISYFTVKMIFTQDGNEPAECRYIFPTDLKICIFNTYFILENKKIEMEIKTKKEAETVYQEALRENRTAVIGRSLLNGLSEFIVGNLAPESICEVVLNCAFTAQQSNEKTIFFKFPLQVCTNKEVSTTLKGVLKGKF
jgi:hypothetical protein